jgi:hypothetical protein
MYGTVLVNSVLAFILPKHDLRAFLTIIKEFIVKVELGQGFTEHWLILQTHTWKL